MRCLASLMLLVPLVAAGEVQPSMSTPQRVVSLNLCTDELLLSLAKPQQIASVTWLVKDPTLSWFAAQAQAYPSNHGMAEEIVQMRPDLVLAGTFTTPATLSLLRRLGIPITQLEMPTTVMQVKQQIMEVAALLGRAAYGHEVVLEMERALAELPKVPTTSRRPSAVLYQPNGLTAVAGTLVDDVMRIAGLSNLAAIRKLPNYSRLDMEVLIYAQPQLLIMNNYEQKMPSLAQEMLNHPVFSQAFGASQTVVVPSQSWSCGTQQIVRAIEILRIAALEQSPS